MTDALAEAIAIVADATSGEPAKVASAILRLNMRHAVALAEELRRKEGIIEDLRRERIRAWDAAAKGTR